MADELRPPEGTPDLTPFWLRGPDGHHGMMVWSQGAWNSPYSLCRYDPTLLAMMRWSMIGEAKPTPEDAYPLTWKLPPDMTDEAKQELFKALQDHRGPILVVDEEIGPERLPEPLRAAIRRAHILSCWASTGILTEAGRSQVAAGIDLLGRWLDSDVRPETPVTRIMDAWNDFSAQVERGPEGKAGT